MYLMCLMHKICLITAEHEDVNAEVRCYPFDVSLGSSPCDPVFCMTLHYSALHCTSCWKRCSDNA